MSQQVHISSFEHSPCYLLQFIVMRAYADAGTYSILELACPGSQEPIIKILRNIVPS